MSDEPLPSGAGPRPAGPRPAGPRPGATLAVLTLSYVLSMADRSFLSVAAAPLQRDVALTDVQVGLLTGLPFAVCYTTLSIPIAWASDRGHRPRIVACGVLLWSAATAATGLAHGFASLFAARMAVGVGEAALLPAAYAMIGDLFPPARVPRATGVLASGGAVGTGLALLGGGLMLDRLPALVSSALPAWRMSFLAFGAAGVAAAALAAALPEPRRRRAPAEEAGAGALWRHVRADAGFVVPIVASGVLLNSFAYGYVAWVPAYFARVRGWSPTEIGATFGTAALLGGVVGGPAWGWLGARLLARGRAATLPLLLGATLALMGLASAAPAMPTGGAAMACVALIPFAAAAVSTLVPAALLGRAPAALRAKALALFLAVVNFAGISLGPLLFAAAAEHVFSGPDALGASLASVSAVLLGAAAAVVGAGLRRGRRHDLIKLS